MNSLFVALIATAAWAAQVHAQGSSQHLGQLVLNPRGERKCLAHGGKRQHHIGSLHQAVGS